MLTVRHFIVLDVPKMILVIQDLMTRLLKDPLWMPEPLEMTLLVGLILGVHVVVVTGLLVSKGTTAPGSTPLFPWQNGRGMPPWGRCWRNLK